MAELAPPSTSKLRVITSEPVKVIGEPLDPPPSAPAITQDLDLDLDFDRDITETVREHPVNVLSINT